jgi:fido (protein-threonine AMPylation protein)
MNKAMLIQKLESYRLHNLNQVGPTLPQLSDSFVTAWIFHDHLLEGRSLSPEEIQGALSHQDHLFPSYYRPLMEDIRMYKQAIELVWNWGNQGTSTLSLSYFKALHKHLLQNEPKEAARYRPNSPVHRDYHQEICSPHRVKPLLKDFFENTQVFDTETQDTLAYAAYLHHQLMHIYPFRRQPGLMARLFTNQFLFAHGYPPLIIASHDKGRYYDALSSHDHLALSQVFYKSVARFLEVEPQFIQHSLNQHAVG